MAAINGLRRFKTVHGILQKTVRQSGISCKSCACAVAVRSRIRAEIVDRHSPMRVFGTHAGRRSTHIDAEPEVDYSRLVPVTREEGKTVSYNAVWLRENCCCEECFLSATSQRAVVYHRLPPEAFVADHVTWAREEGVVEITWADGHLSRYGAVVNIKIEFLMHTKLT